MPGQLVELSPFSMYSRTPVYEVGADIVFGLVQDAVVEDASDDLYIVPPEEAGRLDLIATRFYGTKHLWWVLARVNNLADPIIGVPHGTRIRVPTKNRLANEGVLNI